jgi:hypothetical protein
MGLAVSKPQPSQLNRLFLNAPVQRIAHGVATALLDFSLGILLAGAGAIQPLFFLSNGGRILAGVLGGWLAARRSGGDSTAKPLI